MRINFLICLVLMLFLSGCGIGGWWMEGNPFSAGKPYIPQYLKWSKSGADTNLIQNDWVICGGKRNGSVTIISDNLSQYEEALAYDRKYDEVEACMFNRGYRYIGSCGGPDGLAFRCKKGR